MVAQLGGRLRIALREIDILLPKQRIRCARGMGQRSVAQGLEHCRIAGLIGH